VSEKVTERADGSLVLMCESGNPRLGMIYTPESRGRMIVTMPSEDGHPLSNVNVTFGPEQLDALARLVRLNQRRGSGATKRTRAARRPRDARGR
jgi:hypothetical protein